MVLRGVRGGNGLGAAICALVLAAWLVLAGPAYAARLGAVSVIAAGEGASVEIAGAGVSTRVSGFALAAPNRLVVDLDGLATSAASFEGGGLVAKLRTAQFDKDTARIVLDLTGPARFAASTVVDGKLRLSIATSGPSEFAKLVAAGRRTLITPASSTPPPSLAAIIPAPKSASTAVTTVAATVPQAPARLPGRLPVVVIDAGHGGRDVGAISVLGPTRYEKDVVLAIAKAIKKELDASGRVKAILTRDSDIYLRHRDRFGVARRHNAALFISVHADSAPVPGASGATVYTLSETASDAEAARLAAKENRSDIIAGVDLAIETNEVSDILIDLAQRETMNTSAEFAAILQREMREDVKVRSQFHRFAGFLVLKAPDVPSVLLETGYLSNEEDSKFLFSASGQQRIAKAVRRAVEAHFLRRLAQR